MINCRKCDFFIKGSMRHALMNNCCPACGSAILGETYTQRMRLFKQKLLQQEFAQKLHDDLVFDITLFMLLEFSPVGPEEGGLQGPSDQPDQLDQLDEQDEKEDYEKIRDEIRKEVLSEGGDSLEDLDEDLKVARLKRLAKESKVGRPGTSVRRLGSD